MIYNTNVMKNAILLWLQCQVLTSDPAFGAGLTMICTYKDG